MGHLKIASCCSFQTCFGMGRAAIPDGSIVMNGILGDCASILDGVERSEYGFCGIKNSMPSFRRNSKIDLPMPKSCK